MKWIRLPLRVSISIAASLALLSAAAPAQCPDGTPPPCRGVTLAGSNRKVNPPMNEHAWIVVPFGNAMRAQDLDWLRDASVNLLSMDLGRWRDIAVVDDKRVGDILRDLQGTRAAAPLTLNDGLAIARRAGAANLVMGDFFRVGKGARIVANVFDARTGTRVRSFEQQATDPDSLLTAFGPLARGVLAVPPPNDAKVGAVGTDRIDAYQAYLLGVRALNRFEVKNAVTQLTRALTLDSTFALAHYKLSIAIGWDPNRDSTVERAQAAAAARLAVRLPERQRTVIAGRLAMADRDWPRACAIYQGLVAKDSTDIEALYGLGDCAYHDDAVIVSPTDTTRGAFRSSWNTTITSMRRVLEIDPTYHPAFEHILDIMTVRRRDGCILRPSGACQSWRAALTRDGDSIMTVAVRTEVEVVKQEAQARLQGSSAFRLQVARRIAQNWVDANPTATRAHWHLGQMYLISGQIALADQQFLLARAEELDAPVALPLARIETMVKLGRGAEARALYDSLERATSSDPSMAEVLGTVGAIFGRFERFHRYEQTTPQGKLNPAYYQTMPMVMLGLPVADLNAKERAFLESTPEARCSSQCQRYRTVSSLLYAMRTPRTWWPAFPAVVPDDRMAATRALAVGDTAELRRAARALDSVGRSRTVGFDLETGHTVIAADAYLALGDSVSALRVARFFTDTTMMRLPLGNSVGPIPAAAGLTWPRMMLVRADLAAAAGKNAEAVVWYKRLLDLWTTADPEMQPTLTRIRAAVASLGK